MSLMWAADFSSANDSYAANFENVQYQLDGGSIQNNAAAIPSNVGTALGNALRITLASGELRREATPPGAWNDFVEDEIVYFRFDFLLGDNFQLNTSNWFNCINQIHDAGVSSPPIEFDIESGQLSVRGASATTFNTYHLPLKSVQLGVAYSVIYRVKFSATASNCRLDVWVDGTQVLTDYTPPSPNVNGGPSYWKGATLYRDATIGAEEIYQSNHAVGTTYNDVALLENGNNASYAPDPDTPPGTNLTTTGTATDAFIATVPTSKANATVTWLGADWIPVTTGTPAYRSGALANVERRSTHINYWSARQTAATAGNQTIGMTAPTGQKWSLLAVELAAKTVSGGGGGGGGDTEPSVVPAKFVGGYLPNWITTLPQDVPATYNLLYLAFATINANGSVTFTPSQSPTALADNIATRKAQNKPALLSVGGGGGSQSGLGTTDQQNAFFDSVTAVIDQYGFQGVDWDLETGITGGISVTGIESLSRRLVTRYGSSFAITMAPYGSTASVYKTLATNIADILTFVGYQFYNDNQIPTSSFVLSVMNDWMTTCGLREDQFALGFMHVDTFLGLTTPYTTMASIYNDVNAAHPGVRGVYEWSIELDRAEGYPFAPALGPAVLGTGPAPVPTVRPISEDITTPPAVRREQSTGTAVASASFNPPIGSLVVVLVSVGWKAIPAGTPTLTCTDSLGGVWTAGPLAFGNASQSAIFYRRITALSGITVTVTSSSTELKAMLLAPRVLLNTAESQAGAGRFTVTNSMTSTLGTTTEGSWAYVASSSGNNVALTPTAATTNIDAWVDPVSGDDMALGRMTNKTAAPGSVSLGWSGAGRSAALEILPGIALPTRSFTLGSPAPEIDGVSRIFRGVIGPAGETNTVSPIRRGRARELGSVIEYDAVSPIFDKQLVSEEAWADAIESDDRQPVIGLFADWARDGQFAHPLSNLTPLVESVTVERSIDGTLPAEVGLVEGSSSASLRAELVGRWSSDDTDTTVGVPEATPVAGFGTIPFGTGPFGGGTAGTAPGVAASPTWEDGLSPVEAFAPYRPDAPFYGRPMIGTAVKFDSGFVTDDGPRLDRRFTGSIRRVNPSSAKQTVSLTGLDPANMLRKPIYQPSIGIDKLILDTYGPDRYLHRYNSQWLIDRVLRENGIYASPPPHPKAVVSVTGHGAYIPEIGHGMQPFERSEGSPTIDSTWTNEGHPYGMLYNHPDGPPVAAILRAYGQSPVNMNAGSVIGMSAWMRMPNYAQTGVVLQSEQSFGFNYSMLLAVRNGQPGCSLSLNGNTYRLYATDWVIPAEPVWMFVAAEVQFSDTTAIMTLRANKKTYTVTYSIVARPGARAESRVVALGGVPATNMSVWPGQYGATDDTLYGLRGEEKWVSQADIDPGLNNFTHIPELAGEDSWKLIQEVVGAEFGACGFNESGRFWFRSRAIARDRGDVEEITANRNLTDLVTTLDESAVRNSITVTAAPKYVSDEWEWVFELKDPLKMELGPGWSIYDLPLKEDTVEIAGRLTGTEGVPWVYFVPDNWEQHTQARWERRVVMCPIVGTTTAPSIVDIKAYGQMIIYLDLIAPRVARMAIHNPTPLSFRFARPSTSTVTTGTSTAAADEEPAFKIPGRVLKEYEKTAQTITDEGSVRDFGKRTYDLGGESRWRHDLEACAGIGESVLADTGRPVPVLEGVVVPHDPRRRLYGAVNVADPDGQGSVPGLIAGIAETHSSAGATDSLTVRPFGPPGLGIIEDPVLGLLDETLILGT